ncbi:hypothetical protein FQN54_006436 [Arachnomyces sp. PD_36]|nr:hypothetical protein FQN54_006436 [Arachnomyces sp. PD_36]
MAPQAKRRKVTTTAVEELNFDPDARQEFLTGFHKRKVQRAKNAQEIAEKKAKEEKRESRRKLREERNAGIQKAIEDNKAMIKSMRDSSDEESGGSEGEEEDEWEGFAEPPAVDYEAEYIDEDKYTTVTVEDLDPSKEEEEETQYDGKQTNGEDKEVKHPTPSIPRKNSRPKGKPDKSKSKKKFRYENKAERKFARIKTRASNGAKAKARREK